MIAIRILEWQTLDALQAPELRNVELGPEGSVRQLATALADSGRLLITELRTGLRIEATSFVGRVRVGPLDITVAPKLPGLQLVQLLRYAYGLRDLRLSDSSVYDTTDHAFQEILAYQLCAEVSELLSRGLHRDYVRRRERLASPRGRIDVKIMAQEPLGQSTSLPCIHHPRLEDCLHNRMLLSGLAYARSLVRDRPLQMRLARAEKILQSSVSEVALSQEAFERIRRATTRLTAAYRPAISLLQLLWEGQGLSLETDAGLRLPGFLFDMNRFFQALLGRFLNEYLPADLRQEFRLRGVFAYLPEWNPQHRCAPQPRPDFVLLEGRSVIAVLDAKYRDLWAYPLPREMLYQLAIYALSQEHCRQAAILYPTLSEAASEARITIQESVRGDQRAMVVLRPVNMMRLASLIIGRGLTVERERAEYAQRLARGGAGLGTTAPLIRSSA